ncbi:MAG: DUF1993 family protein [Betaproteobacteria bacterium]|nr:DUF1993 family protein [Betaproteobacteria bacterium]
MALSMYQASVPVFVKTLGNLTSILGKGAAFAAAKKVDHAVLLGYRIAPDMLPMNRQVQIACDFAKGACARLAGLDVPAWEDNEKTFEDLISRAERTIAYCKEFKAAQIDGSEDRDINVKVAGNPVTYKGQPYLLHSVMPNFFFHTTTAYDILRHCGVEIGKRDFIGQV